MCGFPSCGLGAKIWQRSNDILECLRRDGRTKESFHKENITQKGGDLRKARTWGGGGPGLS